MNIIGRCNETGSISVFGAQAKSFAVAKPGTQIYNCFWKVVLCNTTYYLSRHFEFADTAQETFVLHATCSAWHIKNDL